MNNWSTSQELSWKVKFECQLCLSPVSCLSYLSRLSCLSRLSRVLHTFAQFGRETTIDANIRILKCRISWPRNSVVFKNMTNIRYDSGLQQQYKKSNIDYLGH